MVQFPSLDTTTYRGRAPTVSSTHHPAETAHTGRIRSKSFTEQTQEVAKVLAPPISVPLVIMCLLWYFTSAVSNTLAKSILNQFDSPVSLTMVQFLYSTTFGTIFCYVCTKIPEIALMCPQNLVSSRGLPRPNATIVRATGAMASFQLAGQILSYTSMSQIPVSMVHAIKSLSPLFTVMASSVILGLRYNWSTYVALVPLTLGVVMTCGAEFMARPMAIMYALVATMIFVSQNMFSKRLLTTGDHTNSVKLDKMTILCWYNVFAFLGTFPIWVVTDGYRLLTRGVVLQGSLAELLYLMTLNGLSHFLQNLLAFLVLGSISSVSYSIASLLKRIVVIAVAILWFGQPVTTKQGWGIAITFFGLYIYDRFGSKVPPVVPAHRAALPR